MLTRGKTRQHPYYACIWNTLKKKKCVYWEKLENEKKKLQIYKAEKSSCSAVAPFADD